MRWSIKRVPSSASVRLSGGRWRARGISLACAGVWLLLAVDAAQAQELGAHRRLLPVEPLPSASTAPGLAQHPVASEYPDATGRTVRPMSSVDGGNLPGATASVVQAAVADTAADRAAQDAMNSASAPVAPEPSWAVVQGPAPLEPKPSWATVQDSAPAEAERIGRAAAQRADVDEQAVALLPPPGSPAVASLAGLFQQRQDMHARSDGVPTPAGPLSLVELVGLAVDWQPSINQELGRILQEGEQIRVAKAGYLPQVQGGISTQYNSNTEGGSTRRQVQMLNLSVSQMLYDFGKVSSTIGVAQAGQLVAQAGLLAIVDEVARDTAGTVVDALRYAQLLRVAHEQVEGVEAIAALARRRNELGASNQSDTVQAQARLSAARATVLAMETERARWLSNLQSLTGLNEPPAMEAELPLALGRACMTAKPQWDAIPAMLQARAERLRARSEQDLARANGLPTLSVKGQSSRALNSMPSSYGGDGAMVALEVSAPLYQGGANLAQRRSATYATGAADAAIESVRVKAQRQLYETVTRALSGNEREDILLARERSTRQTRDLYRKQYFDLGTRSLLDLLNAEQELHQARMETINHRFDMSVLQLDCLQWSGELRRFMGLGAGHRRNWEIVDDGH